MDQPNHQPPAGCWTTHHWARVRISGVWLFGAVLLFWSGCAGESASDAGSAPSPPPAAASSGTGSGSQKVLGPFTMDIPAGWIEQTPRSSMRKAQFALPRASGDSEDGELTVFYFGMGQGGSTEGNIRRWISQVSQPDGSSSEDKAKIRRSEVSGLRMTEVDVSGTLRASNMPGAQPRPARTGYRLLGVVLESPQGPWFFKLVGPEKTISRWAESFRQFIGSAKTH